MYAYPASHTPSLVGGLFATGFMGNRGGTIGGNGNFAAATGRHSDGSNFLLADGHVKWLRGSQVSSGNSATNATDAQNAGSFQAAELRTAPTLTPPHPVESRRRRLGTGTALGYLSRRFFVP